MKKIVAISLATLAAAACAPAAPLEMTEAAQSQLAEELRGRVAGPPVSCVSQHLLRGNRSIGEGAIIFDSTSNLLYVNRPPAGCPELRHGRALVTRTSTGQLCRGDIASVLDTASGMQFGSCGLGDFTPYRRTRG